MSTPWRECLLKKQAHGRPGAKAPSATESQAARRPWLKRSHRFQVVKARECFQAPCPPWNLEKSPTTNRRDRRLGKPVGNACRVPWKHVGAVKRTSNKPSGTGRKATSNPETLRSLATMENGNRESRNIATWKPREWPQTK